MAPTFLSAPQPPKGTPYHAASTSTSTETTTPPNQETRRTLNDARFDVAQACSRLRTEIDSANTEFEIICECNDDDCFNRIRITLAHYKAIRANPTMSVRSPGHFDHEREHLIAATARFSIIDTTNTDR